MRPNDLVIFKVFHKKNYCPGGKRLAKKIPRQKMARGILIKNHTLLLRSPLLLKF